MHIIVQLAFFAFLGVVGCNHFGWEGLGLPVAVYLLMPWQYGK